MSNDVKAYLTIPTEELPVDYNDFIYKDKSGLSYVTTANLSKYYEIWKKRDFTLNDSDKFATLERTTPCMRKANTIVRGLCGRIDEPGVRASRQTKDVQTMSLELLLSLQLLGTALTVARSNLYGRPVRSEDMESFRLRWGHCATMQLRMIQMGWCASTVAAFASKTPDVQTYVATLKAPRTQNDHSCCTARICLGDQVNEGTYISQHNDRACDCWSLSVQLDEVASIIVSGGIPLIVLPPNIRDRSSAEGSEEDVAYLKSTTNAKYVAISHVWKDGLGNPHKNALPTCQILRLREMVQALYTDQGRARKDYQEGIIKFHEAANEQQNAIEADDFPALWIDTLCVPVRRDAREVRQQALRGLRHVYRDADKVLILDQELQGILLDQLSWKRPQNDRTQVMFRFAMSSWNSRLWTLEEGRLATDLYLVLKDGIIRAKDLYSRTGIDLDRLHNVVEEGSSLLSSICFSDYDVRPERALGKILLSLRNRQTSRASDETICLTSMLHRDPLEVTKAEPQHRMRIFLEATGTLPPSILFMGEPRLREKGFRWAPTSFLHRRDRCYDTERHVIQTGHHPDPERRAAQVSTDRSGLLIESPGMVLTVFEDLPDDPEFLVDLCPDKDYMLTARYDRDTEVDDVSWEMTKAEYHGRTAGLIIAGWARNYRQPVDCVLVALADCNSQSSEHIVVNVVCSFQVLEFPTLQIGEVPGGKQPRTAVGKWCDKRQPWLVD